jgi:pyruvate dehydrogenase complex dehydrogenase (E1) component
MKTKDKIKSEMSLTNQLREIRDKVSIEIKDMTSEELKDYFNKKETLHPNAVWQNVRQTE